ncbi:hypothetical protein SAMN05443550_108155 [Pedobacter hartonius]|uniref:Uncharacterized protein n=1 Tax=Pedobacter hartonius TaxID=425514 RepID=A0A1H4FVH6_9SPHI|nr:hypothetical protein SAMN05443550_108155 [Pedobacter hartonius]
MQEIALTIGVVVLVAFFFSPYELTMEEDDV